MLKGAVTLYSNSAGQPTGYGEQAKYLLERLKRDGAEVAMLSNYGLEGNVQTLETPYGAVPHYPRGLDPYSNDVAPIHHRHFTSQHKDLPELLIGLYDCWIINGEAWDKIPTAWWTPLDHVTMPPLVEKFLKKPNVTPIAMAKHGVRQMESKGIEAVYIPHGVDTKVFKPTFKIEGQDTRDYIGAGERFVVGMVAANKASGLVHRKAFSENLIAFAAFHSKHPDSMLYLHTDPVGSAGGWNLLKMLGALGIPKESVAFPNPVDYKYGIPQQHLAAYYTAMDVMLAPGYGEGFGVPTIEAQACGTRVIGSSWAATPDLLSEDCWMVEGQLQWDAGQDAFWMSPKIESIELALEQAYNADRAKSFFAVEFASEFDVETVWKRDWLPFLSNVLKQVN